MILTIISGASRGIGRAIAEDLRGLGHKFILLSSYVVGFYDYDAVYEKVCQMLDNNNDDIEQINIILCAAQIGTAHNTDPKEADTLYRINVLGNLSVINAVVDSFREDPPRMRIVWFAGGGAAYPFPDFFAYSLSKVAVVRAVENLSISLKKTIENLCIIALAPGAVDTDMLRAVIESGSEIRTHTDISEPVNFVHKFITDKLDTQRLNGKFLHVRDNLNLLSWEEVIDKDIYKLRRIEHLR